MNFSVLMSLYFRESPHFLHECLKSIYQQTVHASEIVVVEDGPLTPDLYAVVEQWKSKLPIVSVRLDENVGLGKALNEGLKHCKFDIIARMDTDDICHPQRFEKQLKIMELGLIDVCGSLVSEFESNPGNTIAYRSTKEFHDDIVRESKLRNPINHPSVMYVKSAVLDVDGYDDVLYFEDYHLWLKLIKSGCRFYNIQESLVAMRAGTGLLSRRWGFRYSFLEISFLKRSCTEKVMSKRDGLRNALIRFPLRILPKKALGIIYKLIRNRNIGREI